MFTTLLRQLRPALVTLIILTIITGLAYPALITGLAQTLFPSQADGSLIEKNNTVAGSALIGQPFSSPTHFWGRPSATSPKPYDASNSSGSNLGPTNPVLLTAVKNRIALLRQAGADTGPVPADLVTASGSGLDPDISPAAALYQVPRVAQATGLPEQTVRALVQAHIEGRQFGILGEPRVNVLELNMALDALQKK